MNKKQDIIKEVEQYINGKYNLGIIDDKIVKDCINKTLEVINYTRCCTELKDEEVRTFEDFLRLFCEETGKQKWIYNDSVWSLDYLFYKYKELYKSL